MIKKNALQTLFHSDPLLLMSIITIAVTIALVPLCHLLWLLSIVLSVMGIAMGMIDTTANVCLIKIYGPQVSPFLQALHFCYGIGAFISPIVAEPFLLNEDCTPLLSYNQSVDTDKIARDITSPSVTDQTFTTMETLIEAQERTEVRFAFWIMALIQIPVVCMVLALLIKKRCFNSAKPKRKYEDIDKVSEATSLKAKAASKTNCCGSSSSTVIAITCLTALILFIYDGLQAAYGGYVYTYSVKSVIDLSSTEGAYLTSVYWGSFALGRLVSIPISTKVSPACMLFVNVIGCFASYVMELFFRHNNIAMYVGSATFGLFLSSIYPTALAWAESFINVTGPVTSVIVIGAATGEMLFPVIVGRVCIQLCNSLKLQTCDQINRNASSLSLTWCRACCCFASRESLLGKEVSYYTRFNEDIDAIKLVPVNEQVPPQKTKEIH
uniref:Major facilitator superfamily domain-containing protein 4A n=1 Tax=Saccoglossus kowalevskii TaxID=10224 RepID=A0ABM0LXG1_SACKO|nr:PREDICTED: major facilitator superfamily domain-containing protein 4-like [Saccoglossus kowalevskii]